MDPREMTWLEWMGVAVIMGGLVVLHDSHVIIIGMLFLIYAKLNKLNKLNKRAM